MGQSTAIFLLVSFISASPLVGFAFLPPAQPQLTNFDFRIDAPRSPRIISAAQTTAAAELGAGARPARVDFDPVTGAPAMVSKPYGFLSTVQNQSLVDDPYGPTIAFLNQHTNLYGHGAEVLDTARIKREFTTPHSGLQTVVWEQQVQGIAIFEGLLISHTTKNGALVNISSHFLPDADLAATQGTPDRLRLASSPSITSPQAVAMAAANLGEAGTVEDVKVSEKSVAAPEQNQKLQAPFLLGDAEAKLTWLPLSKDKLKLSWDIVLTSRKRGEMFRILLDAETGEVLIRRCLTDYVSDATFRVFTSDSPSPFSPGLSTPGTNQPSPTARTLVTTTALDTNASPAGWIDDGGNETRGNNVDAHTDRNNDNIPDLPRPQGSPFRVFDFPLDLNQSPTLYSQAAVVQLFYLCNWMHDRLYQLGFTEAAGNFQSNNFGRGGLGNDAVQADAQDGGGFNNANFSTPPDGSAGRMQMYLFDGPSPDRDGDFDAEIVLHEYTHGLSNRRVGGGVGISALQSAGMGEGWSDFYGLALLSEAGDDVNGNYAAGGYATYQLSGMTQNYYYGIRRYPYTTDLSKNPLTFKDIDPGQASTHPGIPRSSIIGNSANEVHNQGELWCVTLWEARANLIGKYGWAIGNQLILQLVTDGMNLSPANPNFLQARDAILQADLVDTGGANSAALWAAFAKRGMGPAATSPASSTTTGVHESFDLPDDLQITPLVLSANGPVGGPFTPNSSAFALTNGGTNILNWVLANTTAWVNVSPSNGTLVSGGTATTVTVTLNAGANSFTPGVYKAVIWFTNQSSGIAQARSFSLSVVGQNMFDDFEPGIDLSQWSEFGGTVGSTVLATNYGGSISGVNSLWFGDGGSRYATTLPIKTSSGGSISFYVRLANGPGSPWELVDDLPNEGVVLESSSNGGGTWTLLGSYDKLAYYNWTSIIMPIPVPAQGSAVQFRWRQKSHSGSGLDHWALDDVFINAGPLPPTFLTQPQSQTVVVGETAAFSVSAVGTQPLTYQWRLNGTNINGATTSSLSLANVQFSAAGLYSIFLSNGLGTASSSNATLTVIAAPPCAPPPPNLVSWWKAESNPLDQAGVNNGTLVGNATFGPGRVGQGFVFDGISGGVLMGNSISLQLQDLTIETWLKRGNTTVVSSGSGGNGTLLGCGSGGYFFWMRQDGFVGFNRLGDTEYMANFAITDTNYHHVAVSKSGGSIFFYIDGAAFAGPFYNPTFNFPNSVAIGYRPDNSDNSFLGTIDELSIYSRALSGSEILAIFNAGSSGKCTAATAPVILSQPTSRTVSIGGNTSFNILAGGTPPLAYQWSFNGTNLNGATTTSLNLTNVQLAQAGNYAVLVSNAIGAITSSNAVLTVVSSPPCLTPPGGLRGFWTAEGNANDIIGGNNGVLHGGLGFSQGKVGQAFGFNGSNAYVSVAASSALNVGLSNGFTIECWISPSDVSRTHLIAEWNNGNGGIGAHFYHSDPGIGGGGALAANIMDTSGSTHVFASASSLITLNTFQHIAVTYDKASGTAKLFRNGVVIASQNVGVFTPQTSYPLYFGTRVSGPAAVGSFYAGLLDEVSLYARALADSEIAAIFNAGSAGKCPANRQPIAANLVAATFQNQAIGIPSEKFLLASSDPDGDPLTLSAVSGSSTNGGSVILGTNDVIYAPATNFIGLDRFTYTISDGRGGVASAFVQIQVRDPNQVSGNMLPLSPIPGGYLVSFAGVPGRTYTLQRSAAVNGPWATLAQVMAGTSGIGSYADTNAPPAGAYYRTVYP